MSAPVGRPGYELAVAATVLELILAVLLTLATGALAVLAPTLGGLGTSGGAEGESPLPFSVRGLGFSPLDAALSLLAGLTALLWLWVGLDWAYVVRPLSRRRLVDAEAPALLLGLLQTAFGGILPGILLLVGSRQVRAGIRADPALEAERSSPKVPVAGSVDARSRLFARLAMVGLGVLWGIAGVSMFQSQFYLNVPALIRSASQGLPGFLSGWFHFWVFVSSLGSQPAVYAAGTFQILLAFALVAGFARKLAYYAGLVAAVFLWVVPEAFGGPFVLGAFSLGPGVVYATGLLALMALSAAHGTDLATVDGLIERRWPSWARLAEVSSGLVPQIGRWYVRHAGRLARAAELALGAILFGSATLAWSSRLTTGLAPALAARAANGGGLLGGWDAWWAEVARGSGPWMALTVIAVEYAVATALLAGVARKVAYGAGIALTVFIWAAVEGFGGAPGPGYTDPGVGIAEALVFLALLGVVASRISEGRTLDRWVVDRLPAWRRLSRFSDG